jgi:hypothetical protein
VPDFRAYVVGPDGHFLGVHEIEATDRGEATKIALGYVDGHPVELWEGAIWIGTFKPSPTDGVPLLKRLRRERKPKS